MASLVLTGIGACVFADEVYSSTDLNRRSAEVLNHARLRPVTISRNTEQFALLRREEAARLVQTVKVFGGVVELLSEIQSAIAGQTPSHNFLWLKAFDFDKDDLTRMFSEVLGSIRSAFLERASFEDVEAVIHEWMESASVAQSGVLASAMFEPAEEALLPISETMIETIPSSPSSSWQTS